MTLFSLRLFEMRLAAMALLTPSGLGNAMLYCSEGSATVDGNGLAADQVRHAAGGLEVRAGAGGARLLCFELAAQRAPPPPGELKLAETISLDPGAEYLMRCDRVDFPAGGIAYLHTHQGPGIRCLLHGHISVETEGRVLQIEPFEAWFEAGPAPVLARASKTAETAFVRVMVLPRTLLGESSIRYVLPEDRDKPKRQRYTVFQDIPISL